MIKTPEMSKKVKVVSTLGPMTNSLESVIQLAQAGTNVFRINLSHATEPEKVKDNIDWIRTAEKQLGRPLAAMGDLPGLKVRVGDVVPETRLATGSVVEIFSNSGVEGNVSGFGVNYPEVVPQLKPGTRIYIDDGSLMLLAKEPTENGYNAEVKVGGPLLPNKGFDAEGISVKTTGITEKDREGIKLLIEENIDAIAISFVQTHHDIHAVRELIPNDKNIMLIAKIETASAVENIDSILEASDGIMIARGDLGLAVPVEDVPKIQERLIRLANKAARPVITATQMLESMITKPIPTRAEATDVATAVKQGTSAVMLSAETAMGDHAIEAVHQMVRLITKYENEQVDYMFDGATTLSDEISYAAVNIADRYGLKAIIAFTETGSTARRISRHMPSAYIFALSPNEATVRQLTFSRGVQPVLTNRVANIDELDRQAQTEVKNNTICPLKEGEEFIITAGQPIGEPGSTNGLQVATVK